MAPKTKKHKYVSDPDADAGIIENAASANECTGLIPTPGDGDYDEYDDIVDFEAPHKSNF